MNGHIVFSNMSIEEEFKLNGTLCEPTIERLIDREIEQSNICLDGARVYIREAKGSFVSENFMGDTVAEIRKIANRLRGHNKNELMELVQRLSLIESETIRESEYGSDCLRKAIIELDPHQR